MVHTCTTIIVYACATIIVHACTIIDHSTCMYYDHSRCISYDYSTCIYLDHSTCVYYDHSTCMYMIIVHACTMIIVHLSCPEGLCSENGGRSPLRKQGGLGAASPPMVCFDNKYVLFFLRTFHNLEIKFGCFRCTPGAAWGGVVEAKLNKSFQNGELWPNTNFDKPNNS